MILLMTYPQKTVRESVTDLIAILGAGLRAAFSTPADRDGESPQNRSTDPHFEGWVHNDPMVTGNPASRYGDDAPGYLTGNGLGSLEIGAADD